MSLKRQRFESVVFAGGGCRCFWQAGFWETASPALALAPRVVGAVSAGAAFACASLAGIGPRVVADFTSRARRNRKNFYPARALSQEPVFPHEQLYRSAVVECIDDEALARLHRGPELRVLIARPPSERAVAASLLLGLAAYKLERKLTGRVHARWPQRLGFRSEVVKVSDCRTPHELADLLLQSSCTPPVTPLMRRGGRTVIDGGLFDNVPVDLVDDAEDVLVLLTRRYSNLPSAPGRVYAQPSEPIPVKTWDYTRPEQLQAAYDLGRKDGEAFARERRGISGR